MLQHFFNNAKAQAQLGGQLERAVKTVEFETLGQLDPERLVGNDLNERISNFHAIAMERGIDLRMVNGDILRQIIFTTIAKKWERSNIFVWGKHLGFDDGYIEATIHRVLSDCQQLVQTSAPAAPVAPQTNPAKALPKKPKSSPPPDSKIEDPKTVEVQDQRILTPMEEVGLAIVSGYKAHKLAATFDLGRSCGDGPRCRRYVFTKPVETPFTQYERYIAESMSNAGLDPERDVWFSRLANNQFEIQVAKHVSEWQINALFTVLTSSANFRTTPRNLDEMVQGIRSACSFQVNDRLQAVFAIDVDANLTHLDLSSGCAIVGASDSGKSTGIKTILASLMLTCPNFSAAYIDLKDGLTLERFNGLPSTWQEVATTSEGCTDLLESLEVEKDRRGGLLKKAKVENIIEYNALSGEEPLNWLPIVIEEVALMKQIVGADWTEEKLSTIAQAWRCYGMPLICVTQYPTQKLSIGPGIRINMGAAVAFRGTEGLGELVFGESSPWNKKVARLTGAGDCIIKQAGSYVRAQCLYTDGKSLNSLIDMMKQERQVFAQKQAPVLSFASDAVDAVSEFDQLFKDL